MSNRAGIEIAAKAEKLAEEKGIGLAEATGKVLFSNPELARQYIIGEKPAGQDDLSDFWKAWSLSQNEGIPMGAAMARLLRTA